MFLYIPHTSSLKLTSQHTDISVSKIKRMKNVLKSNEGQRLLRIVKGLRSYLFARQQVSLPQLPGCWQKT